MEVIVDFLLSFTKTVEGVIMDTWRIIWGMASSTQGCVNARHTTQKGTNDIGEQ